MMNGVKADFLSQEKLKKVETEGLLTKTPSEVTETSFRDRKTLRFYVSNGFTMQVSVSVK